MRKSPKVRPPRSSAWAHVALLAAACGAPNHRIVAVTATEGVAGQGGSGAAATGGSRDAGRDATVTPSTTIDAAAPQDASVTDARAKTDAAAAEPPDMRPAPDLRPPAPNDRVAPAAGPGLVGYWAFDDGTGTTAEDASPNGNRARLKSGKLEWVDGKYGWAAKLSGDASLVVDKSDSLDSISRTNRLTVSAWIWPNTVGQVDIAFVLSRQLGATGDEVFGLSLWDGKPAFNMQGLVARGPAPVSAQHWVHLAGVYDGARLRVYLDGVEAGTTEATVVTPSDPNPVLISGNVNTENGVTTERKFFDGYVDDVRIYDRALGADEIRALAK